MVLDKKKFNNTITAGCDLLSSDNKRQCVNEIKKCSNSTSKCKNEYINMFNAKPKQEDILKCVSSSQKNTMKCIDELNKKTNYNEHNAKRGHCIANKCPGIYNNTISNLLKNTMSLIKFQRKNIFFFD